MLGWEWRGEFEVEEHLAVGNAGRGVQAGAGEAAATQDGTLRLEAVEVVVHTLRHVLEVGARDVAIHGPHVGAQDAVVDHVGGANHGQEGELRVIAGGAVAPQAIAVLANDGGDLLLVEQVGAAVGVTQGEVDVAAGADDAVDHLVGRRPPEAQVVVDLGDQAGHSSAGGLVDDLAQGVANLDGGVDDVDALAAPVAAVGDGLGVGGVRAVGNHHGAQALGDADHLGDHGVGEVGAGAGEARCAQDAGAEAVGRLTAQEGMHALISTSGDVHAADHVADGGFVIHPLGHADHDHDRTGLVEDAVECSGQRAGQAELGGHGSIARHQNGGVEWEHVVQAASQGCAALGGHHTRAGAGTSVGDGEQRVGGGVRLDSGLDLGGGGGDRAAAVGGQVHGHVTAADRHR